MQTLNFDTMVKQYVASDSKEIVLFTDVIFSQLPAIKEYGWLAGGSLRRLITRQKLDSDFDFFFTSEEKFKKYYELIRANQNIQILNESENESNKTIRAFILGAAKGVKHEVILQLIKIQYYPTVDKLLESFDFTLCQLATDLDNLYCGDYALFDIGNKRIVVNKITYPVASLRRMIKYTQQGYYACNGALTSFLTTLAEQPTLLKNISKYID